MSTTSTLAPDLTHIETLELAVGVPGGLVLDDSGPTSEHRAAGAVRLGGSVVFLPDQDYAQWSRLLRPQPATPETRGISIRLAEQGLVAVLDSWAAARHALMPLRALMLGSALGNVDGEPDRFLYRPAGTGPQVIVLDPVENLIAWKFDGSASLGDAVNGVATRMRDIPLDTIEAIAVRLVLRLMAHQSLYLDAHPTARAV